MKYSFSKFFFKKNDLNNFYIKFFPFLVSQFLILINILIKKIFNNNYFLALIPDSIEKKQYYSKAILNKKNFFSVPQHRLWEELKVYLHKSLKH